MIPMKRILCLFAALLLCAGLALPAYANGFVPSVSRPAEPEIKGDVILAEKEHIEDGEGVGACVVITTVKEAKEKTTDIYQEERDLLIEVHQQLFSGAMQVPTPENYVILDVVDVNFQKDGCVETPHTHEEELKQETTVLVAQFNLGVENTEDVVVMLYVNDQWEPVEQVTHNGDGTITCHFQATGPVAFCMPGAEPEQTLPAVTLPSPEPAEEVGYPLLWVIMLIVAFLLFLLLIFLRRKRKKEEEEGK